MSVRGDILKALDREWRGALDVFERVGAWSPVSIRHTLKLMADAGEIEQRKTPINSGFRYEYRATG